MDLTVEKLILLSADVLVTPLFTEVSWREWDGREWIKKKRRITKEKSNLIVAQAARIKEIQLLKLN